MTFEEEDDEKLIEMVAKHPSLFDLKSPAYKNQRIKDNAWKDISQVINKQADECKKRWKNIKDTYRRRKQKGKDTGAAASSKGKKWPLMDMLTFLNDTEHQRKSTSNINTASDEYDSDSQMGPQVCEDSQTSDVNVEDIISSQTSNFDSSSNSVPFSAATPELHDKQKRPSKRPRRYQSENSNETVINLLKQISLERSEFMKTFLTQKGKHPIDLFCESIAASLKALPPDLCNEGKVRFLQVLSELEYRNQHQTVTYVTSQPSASNTSSTIATPLSSREANIQNIEDIHITYLS